MHPFRPDWADDSHSLACTISEPGGGCLYLALNAYWGRLTFRLPFVDPGLCWQCLIDTAAAASARCHAGVGGFC